MIEIRPETAGDAAAIDLVVSAAFPTDGEARLVAALRSTGKLRVSLVAIREEQIVGHAALSNVSLDPPCSTADVVGLAPVAVAPEFQRQGIGSELVKRSLTTARELGVSAIVVLGEPEFYSRFGFRRASDLGLQNEYGVHDPFMVAELQPESLAGICALARYAEEFGAL